MELTFLILRTRQIHTKPLFVSESTFKIKAISLLIFSSILLRSAVICKQRLFHKNEIVQYLQNYKYQDVNGDNFKKQLQTSKKAKKNNYPETAHKFLMCCSIFTYFLRFYCYNFRTVLTNQSIYITSINCEISLYPLKTGQNSHSYSNLVRNNGYLKVLFLFLFYFLFFLACFFERFKRYCTEFLTS